VPLLQNAEGALAPDVLVEVIMLLILIGIWSAVDYYGGIGNAVVRSDGAFSGSAAKEELGLGIIAPSQPFYISRDGWLLVAGPSTLHQLESATGPLTEEIKLYPKELFHKVGVERILLCENLMMGPIFQVDHCGGVALHLDGTLVLDIGLLKAAQNHYSLRHGFHHELFHFIDAHLGPGEALRHQWNDLNEPEFRYRLNSSNARSNGANEMSGFLSHYSMENGIEDRAEVFAYLVNYPEYVSSRCQDDRVIERKVSFIKERVQAYCPELNASFWARIQTLKRYEAVNSNRTATKETASEETLPQRNTQRYVPSAQANQDSAVESLNHIAFGIILLGLVVLPVLVVSICGVR
jgi:hypothetical protein